MESGHRKTVTVEVLECSSLCPLDFTNWYRSRGQFNFRMSRASCVLLVVASLFVYSSGHTYHLGSCPVVDPMTGFEMNKVNVVEN